MSPILDISEKEEYETEFDDEENDATYEVTEKDLNRIESDDEEFLLSTSRKRVCN